MKNNIPTLIILLFVALLPFASAGVGIKWDRESALAAGGEEACLTYGVYNPWPEETYVKISVSEELQKVLIVQEKNATLIPAQTASKDAIPIEFCFKVPKEIYKEDCWLGNFFVCEQQCKENQRIYEGDVVVESVPPPTGGGSSASMAVSAPLRIKVRCDAHPRNYSLLYLAIALIAAIIIITMLYKKYRKPKAERYKEKMKRLKDKLAKEEKK